MGNFGPLSVQPTVYIPVSQATTDFFKLVHTWFAPKWVVRGAGANGALAARVQSAIAAVDPQLPVSHFLTADDLQRQVTQRQKYNAVIFSLLAGLALVLAAVGLYGIISQSVTLRTREIGIRMALGASTRASITNAMRPGLLFTVAGVALGMLLSVAAARFLRHMLWGVQAMDTVTFLATATLLFIVAVVASCCRLFACCGWIRRRPSGVTETPTPAIPRLHRSDTAPAFQRE